MLFKGTIGYGQSKVIWRLRRKGKIPAPLYYTCCFKCWKDFEQITDIALLSSSSKTEIIFYKLILVTEGEQHSVGQHSVGEHGFSYTFLSNNGKIITYSLCK